MQVNELLEHSLIRMQGRHSPEAEQILRALHPGLASNEHDILPAVPTTREDGYISKLASSGFMVRPSPTLSRDAPRHHEMEKYYQSAAKEHAEVPPNVNVHGSDLQRQQEV